MIDFTLSDEQNQMQELVRRFAEREIAPSVQARDRHEALPLNIMSDLAEMGLLGSLIPQQYGGLGIDYITYGLVCEELGRVDPSIRSMLSAHVSLAAASIVRWGSEEQKQTYLPDLASGKKLACFALTESEAGSDAKALGSRAAPGKSGWVLDGSKMFITNGTQADLAIVFARGGDSENPERLSAFIVPADREGFQCRRLTGKLGLRSSDVAEITFDSVELQDSELLGQPGDGWRIALSALDGGRYGLAAGCLGIAEGAVEAAIQYAQARVQFGRPIASFQLVQELIVDAKLEVEAARFLVWRAGWMKDQDRANTLETSLAKLAASQAAIKASDNAIQIHGGYGYFDEFPVHRLLRDARVSTLYEGTTQIQKLIVGKLLTGEAAFA